MNSNKVLVWVFVSFMAMFGMAFADPITVTDFNIQKDNDRDFLLIVSLANANTSTGVFEELDFTIEELGTTKSVGVLRVDDATDVVTYNLRDVTDSFSSLKKGETYTVTVSTVASASSLSESFVFGSERDTEGLGLILEDVEINDVDVNDIDTLQVLNGESLEVQLRMSALESFDDARIMVFLEGYEHSPLVESTDIFEAVEGKTYIKTVSLNLPADIDNRQDYKLRIVGANDLSGITYKEFTLFVDTDRHRVDIVDLVLTPSSGVEPGQNIIANVRMKNRGQKDQDSTKVVVSIPELGISEAAYTSNLNPGEVATSEDLLLFVPENAAAGQYDVVVTLAYDDGYTSTTDSFSMNIMSPRLVEEENLLVSFKNNVDLAEDSERSFEVVIANPNAEAKPISLAVLDNAWAVSSVSPTLSMVSGGSSETYTVTVTPKDGSAGENSLVLVVKERDRVVSEFTVDTFVAGSEDINWLNLVLVVLLIIAIIVLLALVITIAKRKGDDDDGEEISSTEEYY